MNTNMSKKLELLSKIKTAHEKYTEWWNPIDMNCNSCMGPMDFFFFCRASLLNDGGMNPGMTPIESWWNAFFGKTNRIDKFYLKKFMLDLFIMRLTNTVPKEFEEFIYSHSTKDSTSVS